MFSIRSLQILAVVVLALVMFIHLPPASADTNQAPLTTSEQLDLTSDQMDREQLKSWPGEQTDDPVNVNIVDFEMVYWPLITLFVQVSDDAGDPIFGLTEENFEVTENDEPVLADVIFADLDGTAYGMALDCSGSMGGYENDVIFACTTFVSWMHPLEQAAIVFFEYFVNTRVVQPMTNNHNWLMNTVLTYYANGSTAQWYGYTLALEQCQYELPPRIMIGFTDGMDNASGSYTQQTTTLLAQLIGAPVYTIGLGGVTPEPLIAIANATGGSYVQTDPDSLWYYYQEIQHAYQNQYEISFITPNPTPDGSLRTHVVQVDYQGDVGEDSSRFAAPWVADFAPVINLTPSTLDPILLYPQSQGNPVTVGAYVTDNDVLNNVMIRFRYIGETYYNHAIMTHVSDSLFEHTFDGSYIQEPGVEFYLLASDSYYHTTSEPEHEPAAYPYQVVVEPNARPEITHTPITTWSELTPLPVICTVVDVTANVDSVVVAYRNESEIYWTEVEMQNTGGDTWETTVPGEDLIASLNLEYFIRAYDNVGTYDTDGPHFVDVAAIPLAVTMTPYNPPIQIPATGGSFDFNVQLSNQGTDPLMFDAWIMVTLPNGNPFGPVLGPVNLTVPGSTTLERDRIQAVPEGAPSGEYVYETLAGLYPDLVWASDSFTFEKIATGDGEIVEGWTNSGEAFDPWLTARIDGIYPSECELIGTYPNPFNATVTIAFSLPDAMPVSLTIYDISGRKAGVVLDGWKDAGTHEMTYDASNLASGVYLYRLEAGSRVSTRKMILLK